MPVQIEQVAQQCQQRKAIARQAEEGLYQQGGAGLHFINHRVGQGAGGLARKQGHVGRQQTLEQRVAKNEHAFIRNARQRVLADKLGCAAYQKNAHDRQRNHPQAQRSLRKTTVQQRLEKRWDQRLSDSPQ